MANKTIYMEMLERGDLFLPRIRSSFIAGMAYTVSSYNMLWSQQKSTAQMVDVFEVMGMTQEVERLTERLNSIDDKYDRKIDKATETLHGIDQRLRTIETKVNLTEERTKTWKLYILIPIITSVLSGVIVKLIAG